MRHRITRHLLVCSTLVGALALAPKEARAEESAADHARKGQVAYDLQDWATASKEFETAYRMEQKPEYIWTLAQVQRLSGKYREAIRSYKAFQRLDVTANQANAAEMMIAKCEAEIAKQEAQQARESDAKSAPAPSPAPAPVEQSPTYDSGPTRDDGGLGIGWFIGGASLTLVLGGVATWSYLDMKSKSSDYRDDPTKEGYDDGKPTELRTQILVGATGAAAIGTVVLAIFTDWEADSGQAAQRPIRIRPAVGTNGGSLFVTGAF